MDDTRTDAEKASALVRAGWVAAGNGDGLLGEDEWWPPAFIQIDALTVPFAEAYRLTAEAARAQQTLT